MRYLAFILLTTVLTTYSTANHLIGGEITYSYISGNSYKIHVTLYRDCNDAKLGGQGGGTSNDNESDLTQAFVRTIASNCQDKTIGSINLTKVGFKNITPICNLNNSACGTNPTYAFGIEAHTYEGIINFNDFSSYSGCPMHIYIFKPSRSENFTTIQVEENNSDNFYNFVYINPWIENKNSPHFLNVPNILYNVNQPVKSGDYASGYGDDSLVYKWATPLKSHNNPLVYNYPFASHQFVSTYCVSGTGCTPNANSNPPQGLSLNMQTGDYAFTPISQNQVSNRVIEIEQWRKAGNNTYLASKIRRDVLVITTSQNQNNIPEISAQNSYDICVGETLDLTVSTADAPIGSLPQDSIYVEYSSSLPTSYFTKSAGKQPTLDISFLASEALVGTHYIRIRARDNFCPKYAESYKTIVINVRPKPSSTLTVSDLFCGNLEFNISPDTYTYSLDIRSNNSFVIQGDTIVSGHVYTSSTPENLHIDLRVRDEYCNDTLSLSYQNKGNSEVTLATLAGDTNYCENAHAQISLHHTTYSVIEQQWTWNNEATQQDTFNTLLTNQGILLYSYILENNGYLCDIADSQMLTIEKAPIISLDLDSERCFQKTIPRAELKAMPSGGIWYCNNQLVDNDLQLAEIIPNATTFIDIKYAYTDENTGCTSEAIEKVHILNAPILELKEQTLCGSNYLYQLRNCIQLPYHYSVENITWNVINNPAAYTSSPFPSINIPQYGTGTYVIEGINTKANGCEVRDTSKVIVLDQLELSYNGLTKICQSEDTINLTEYFGVSAQGGGWRSTAYNSFFVTPQLYVPKECGTHQMVYEFDLNGCYDTLGIEVVTVCKPTFNIQLPDSLCSNSPEIELSNGYEWQGAGVSSHHFFPNQVAVGPHRLRASTVENSCTFDSTFLLSVLAPLHFTLHNLPAKLCEGEDLSVTFNKSSYGKMTGLYCSDLQLVHDSTITYSPTNCDLQAGEINAEIKLASHLNCPTFTQALSIPYFAKPTISLESVTDQCAPYMLSKTLEISDEDAEVSFSINSLNHSQNGYGKQITTELIYSGLYTINGTITDSKGCKNTLTPTSFNVRPTPVAHFEMLNKARLALSERELILSNQSTISNGNFKSDWYYSKQGDKIHFSEEQNPVYEMPVDTGAFDITLVASTPYQCSDTTTSKVLLVPDIIIFIPSAFSPNEKGPEENNKFKIHSDHAQEYHINIFNKWGQKVYTSNQISEAWNGTYLGQNCPVGVYVYVIQLINKSGLEYKYQGTVHLLR